MRVIFSPASRSDLAEIGDYIARDNPVRARRFVEELTVAALAVGDVPSSSPTIGRYRRTGLRRRVHKGYLIIYRVAEGLVEIVRILHGARDVTRLLEEGA